MDRPYKELKNFEKVWLKAGETKRIEMILQADAFRYYDERRHQWVLERGVVDILVGASSADIRQKATIRL